MTVVINKKTTKTEISNLLKEFKLKRNNKTLRTYFGALKLEGNVVEIQKKLRNEWD